MRIDSGMSRRELLKAAGAAAGLALVGSESRGEKSKRLGANPLGTPAEIDYREPDKPIRARQSRQCLRELCEEKA